MDQDEGIERAERLWTGWGGDLRRATEFLTRIPVPGLPVETEPGSLAGAARAFPVVGIGIGLAAALVFVIATFIGLSVWIAAVLAVGTQLLVTGALHEDGLSDVADGFGGGTGRDRKLEIMRDSRIGSYGVAALVLALTVRVAALAALPGTLSVAAALVAAGALSRSAMVLLLRWLTPARQDGLGAEAGVPDTMGVAVASVIAVAVALIVLGPGAGIVVMLAALAAAAVIGWLARRQIGGHSGDVLGASQQAAEIACLIAAAAMLS